MEFMRFLNPVLHEHEYEEFEDDLLHLPPPPQMFQLQGSKIDPLVVMFIADAGEVAFEQETSMVQFGIKHGRKLKPLTEVGCFHPGSHMHSKGTVLFLVIEQFPFPQDTSLHRSPKIGDIDKKSLANVGGR